jgi:hypothetical protein
MASKAQIATVVFKWNTSTNVESREREEAILRSTSFDRYSGTEGNEESSVSKAKNNRKKMEAAAVSARKNSVAGNGSRLQRYSARSCQINERVPLNPDMIEIKN